MNPREAAKQQVAEALKAKRGEARDEEVREWRLRAEASRVAKQFGGVRPQDVYTWFESGVSEADAFMLSAIVSTGVKPEHLEPMVTRMAEGEVNVWMMADGASDPEIPELVQKLGPPLFLAMIMVILLGALVWVGVGIQNILGG